MLSRRLESRATGPYTVVSQLGSLRITTIPVIVCKTALLKVVQGTLNRGQSTEYLNRVSLVSRSLRYVGVGRRCRIAQQCPHHARPVPFFPYFQTLASRNSSRATCSFPTGNRAIESSMGVCGSC